MSVPYPRLPTDQASPSEIGLPHPDLQCAACAKGDNTVGHWVRWCEVPIRALRNLIGDTTILSLVEGSRKGKRHLAIASRVVHQFRLMLRGSNATSNYCTFGIGLELDQAINAKGLF